MHALVLANSVMLKKAYELERENQCEWFPVINVTS